jgi:predicted HicB family RNase H-like nuclease
MNTNTERCTKKLIVRLPPSLCDRLQLKAAEARRSLSNYIVRQLEQLDDRGEGRAA